MDCLDEFITTHQLGYGIYAQNDGEILHTAGDRAALPYQGIVEQYFGNGAQISATYEYLQASASLYQTVSQGELHGLLTVVNETMVMGVFFVDDTDVLTRRRRVNQIYGDLLRCYPAKKISISIIN